MATIPVFKTQYSIGKSLLTTDDVLDIAIYNNIEKTIFVEDSFYGFRDINNKFKDKNKSFVYGIKLPVVQDDGESSYLTPSKLIFFAKNNNGFKKIRDLYTDCYTNDGVLSLVKYKQSFFKDVRIGVPFYDSFVFNNIFNFGLYNLNLNGLDHFYFEEDNKHPFDFQIKKALKSIGANSIKSKSIYYRNKEDFHAFQMYKATCNRRQGRPPTFSNPNLNNFCSEEFCWESFKETA